ncbi:MAG: chemotaxis protein CheB [Pseudomonadota bacterium]
MVDAVSHAAAPRVVLLARAGKAADHLAEAVRQAGAELLVAIDPANADEAALRALNPQAVLVALEPSIEPMLDKLEGLLSDPALTVIYDEADVAAHRAGWDAARWARHLSAKLRHDSNVLPPGTESDQDWQPSPGQIPKPAAAYADVDMTAFTREALAHADSVPADGAPVDVLPVDVMPVDVVPMDVVPEIALLPLDTMPIDAIPASATQDAPVQAPPAHAVPPPLPPVAPPPSDSGIAAFQTSSFETMALESMDAEPGAYAAAADDISFETFATDDGAGETVSLDSMTLDSMTLDSMTLDDVQLDGAQLDSMQLDSMQLESMTLDDAQRDDIALDSGAIAPAPSVVPMRLDEDAFFLEELSATDLPPMRGEPVAMNRFGGDFDGELDLSDEDVAGFEAFDLDAISSADAPSRAPGTLASSEEVMSFEALIASSLAAAAEAPTAPVAPQAEPKPGFSLGDLSLAPVDDAPSMVERPAASPAARDISALEARISSLSLVDLDEGAPAAFGIQAAPVVLIEAGLGGPDPARQLLSSLPAEFMAVVLVRLHLQGGRYDRLVAQMERTAALPVALAQGGATASAGTIYFLPDSIGLTASAGGFGFVDDAAPPASLFAALPSGASALVFLSGSDPQLVQSAMAAAATGTVVLAQSPEDCYDGAACAELRNRGVTSGLPAELAGRLASRWPS